MPCRVSLLLSIPSPVAVLVVAECWLTRYSNGNLHIVSALSVEWNRPAPELQSLEAACSSGSCKETILDLFESAAAAAGEPERAVELMDAVRRQVGRACRCNDSAVCALYADYTGDVCFVRWLHSM